VPLVLHLALQLNTLLLPVLELAVALEVAAAVLVVFVRMLLVQLLAAVHPLKHR
jgi:hypothetical protein